MFAVANIQRFFDISSPKFSFSGQHLNIITHNFFFFNILQLYTELLKVDGLLTDSLAQIKKTISKITLFQLLIASTFKLRK